MLLENTSFTTQGAPTSISNYQSTFKSPE